MKIDLGTKYGGPEVAMSLSPEKPKKHYPTLHIDCGDVMLNSLPDEGVMEVRFKVVSRSCNERDGKKSCCLTLEARQILEVETLEKAMSDPEDGPREALDKLAKLESAGEDEEED